MALKKTKKVPRIPLKGIPVDQLNLAKDGNTVKIWTASDGIVYELSMVPQTEAPASGGSGGTTDHGNLTGLADNDHPQYVLDAGDTMTGLLTLSGDPTSNLHADTLRGREMFTLMMSN